MSKTTPPTHLVLYADDDPDDIKFVEESFAETAHNIELITAFNGLDLLNYLEKLDTVDPDPCLIILDVNMPMLNGKETLQKIRQMDRFENTPVVLFTTSSTDQDKNFAKNLNAGFVTKPLDSKQMRRITETFITHCSDEVQKNIRKFNN